jgi:hypothetical protein
VNAAGAASIPLDGESRPPLRQRCRQNGSKKAKKKKFFPPGREKCKRKRFLEGQVDLVGKWKN